MPALEGMRILDLTQYESGTACTQSLAFLGADVVKVERPGTGDPGRAVVSQFGFEDSLYFLNWNANKRSVTLALETKAGRDVLLDMVPHYDVFIENFGPGVIDKLDLGYDVVRSRREDVLYASIKGFGDDGPYADYKCFDMVAQAAAGAFSVTGDADGPPMRPGPTTGDSGTGVQMALAITAAYVQRLRTGEGQYIELSMQEAMTYFMRTAIAMGTDWGRQAAPRQGSDFGPLVSLYACKPFGPNDYVYIMAPTDRMWEALAHTIGRQELIEDERFATGRGRFEHREELSEAIGTWCSRLDKHEAMRALAEAGVPASKVFDTMDLLDDPHLNERGFIETVEHPVQGAVRVLGWPARLSKSSVGLTLSPSLGEHTDAVVAEDLGLRSEQVEALRRKGAFGPSKGKA
ncbi:MAG: CoA transferase [Acidobacteriota bacterium]